MVCDGNVSLFLRGFIKKAVLCVILLNREKQFTITVLHISLHNFSFLFLNSGNCSSYTAGKKRRVGKKIMSLVAQCQCKNILTFWRTKIIKIHIFKSHNWPQQMSKSKSKVIPELVVFISSHSISSNFENVLMFGVFLWPTFVGELEFCHRESNCRSTPIFLFY